MPYHVGDIVIVRPDLHEDYEYDDVYVVSDMEVYRGMEATITEVLDCELYHIDLDTGCWDWTASMFCGTKEEYETRNNWNKPLTSEVLDSLLKDRMICVSVQSSSDAAELLNMLRARGYNLSGFLDAWHVHGKNTVFLFRKHQWFYDEISRISAQHFDHLIKYTFRAVALSDIEIPDDDIGLLF